MTKSNCQIDFDIIIAGGGMIGTTLALALAPLNLRVAVVEAVSRSAPNQPSFDDRSTALSRSSQRMFEAMGLWPEIVAASTPITKIHVSDRGRFGFAHIDATEQKVDALGYVVINRVLGGVLQDALTSAAAITVMCPAEIVAVSSTEEASFVRIVDKGGERTLSCRLLVAADGANSSTRELIGISAKRVDYDQFAIIGNVLPEKPHNNCAFERFTEAGPIAMLPASNDRVSFVWMQTPEMTESSMNLSDADFLTALQAEFGKRLGSFSKVGARATYPLALTKANGLVGRRGVVIGNAAHGLHPVAAQGFNLGLRDVAALCDCIADYREIAVGELDCCDSTILENYAEWRAPDQRKLVRFTDGLVRLFTDVRPPVRVVRNLAMLGFDLIPGVRSLFAKHTMGLAGRLPRLSRVDNLE